jgi:hypothetical protein
LLGASKALDAPLWCRASLYWTQIGMKETNICGKRGLCVCTGHFGIGIANEGCMTLGDTLSATAKNQDRLNYSQGSVWDILTPSRIKLLVWIQHYDKVFQFPTSTISGPSWSQNAHICITALICTIIKHRSITRSEIQKKTSDAATTILKHHDWYHASWGNGLPGMVTVGTVGPASAAASASTNNTSTTTRRVARKYN